MQKAPPCNPAVTEPYSNTVPSCAVQPCYLTQSGQYRKYHLLTQGQSPPPVPPRSSSLPLSLSSFFVGLWILTVATFSLLFLGILS